MSTRISLLDVDYAATVVVLFEHNDGGYDDKEIVVPLLGDSACSSEVDQTYAGEKWCHHVHSVWLLNQRGDQEASF
jgi:hypothetical protein